MSYASPSQAVLQLTSAPLSASIINMANDRKEAKWKKRPQTIGQIQGSDEIASGSGSIDEKRRSIVEVVIYNKPQHWFAATPESDYSKCLQISISCSLGREIKLNNELNIAAVVENVVILTTNELNSYLNYCSHRWEYRIWKGKRRGILYMSCTAALSAFFVQEAAVVDIVRWCGIARWAVLYEPSQSLECQNLLLATGIISRGAQIPWNSCRFWKECWKSLFTTTIKQHWSLKPSL